MKNALRKINIAIIPPAPVGWRAVVVSRSLLPLGTFFALDQKKYFAHVTLFLGFVPARAIPSIIALTRTVCRQEKSFFFSMDRYRQLFRPYPGYVDVAFLRNPAAIRLRQCVFRGVRPFCTTPELTAKPYVPHMTLTKLRAPEMVVLAKLPRKKFSFRACSVGVFAAGQYGTCRTMLARFLLSA